MEKKLQAGLKAGEMLLTGKISPPVKHEEPAQSTNELLQSLYELELEARRKEEERERARP